MTRTRLRALPAAAAVLLTLALPAVASASSVWVSNSAPVGNDKGCSSPGYNTVQAALNASASGGTVLVCGGTYDEQLEITKPVKLAHVEGTSRATIAMPSTPASSLTSCDTAPGLEPGQKDEISICTSGKVSITALHIEALVPLETCAGGFYDIFVAGGATLEARLDTIVGASTTLDEFKGCQHGVAVEIGSARAEEVGHAVLKEDAISGYEKNGPTVAFTGSTLKAQDVVVTGAGPTPYIAQNGIEVAYGAKGQVKGSNVLDNECEYPEVCSSSDLEEQASGVLFYGAAAGSSVSSSTIADNDLGLYYASTSATAPAKSELKASEDKFQSDRYEGAVLEQGDASLVGDQFTGTSQVGIDLVQSASQPYGDHSSANGLTIEGESVAAVQVVSDLSPSDPPGTFKLDNSSISKNAAEVIDPSATFTISEKNDD